MGAKVMGGIRMVTILQHTIRWSMVLAILLLGGGARSQDSLRLSIRSNFPAGQMAVAVVATNGSYQSTAVNLSSKGSQLTAAIPLADIYNLVLFAPNRANPVSYYPVFLTNESASILLTDTLGNYTVEQGSHPMAFKQLIKDFGGEFGALNELYEAYNSAGTRGYRVDSLNVIREAIKSQIAVKVKPFLTNYGNTEVSAFFLNTIWPLGFSITQYDEWLPLVNANQLSSRYGQSFNIQYQQEKKFGYGQVAPEFAQNAPDGKPIALSDFRGKFVLIDFWASWCGPCRQENPNLVRSFQQYRKNNFTILGVSLDKDKDKWLQAIQADKLDWTHVSDLGFWQNEVAKMYGISSIPQNLLLDPEGKIIGKNLRGAALDEFLRQLFPQ